MPITLLSNSCESRLGWSDMVYSFFSSVSYNLEGQGKWGSRFPKLLIDLCDYGAVAYEDLDALDKELGIVFRELQKFPLSAAVYDIQEPWLPIPWEATPRERLQIWRMHGDTKRKQKLFYGLCGIYSDSKEISNLYCVDSYHRVF